jgi:hydroxymethylpyrimidine pyrophosphatase-like HAD family hydrolase
LATDGRATPLNVRAVLLAARLGVEVVFATGRPARWLQPLADVRAAHPRAIASNGAVTFDIDTAKVVDAYPVPPHDTMDVADDLLTELPDCGFAVEYATGGWGRTPAYPLRGDFVPETVMSESVADLLRFATAVKLLVYSPSLATRPLFESVVPVVADRLAVTYSMVKPDGLLELCAPGVDKASALRRLMTDAGVSSERLAAFGDMPNDVPMLTLARFGYAMANADPTLFDQGFLLAPDHNDSGFGRALLALLGEADTEDACSNADAATR